MQGNPASMLTFQERIDLLGATKMAQTREKQELLGFMDHDDHALILPPPERRQVVHTTSSSGLPIMDCRLNGFELRSNHPCGGFFGARAVGENFRRLLEAHPAYVDAHSSLAGGYMSNFMSFRKPHWNPDLDYAHLREGIERYKLLPGIGAAQHFCQDLQIGLELGWGGILEKIRHYRELNAPHGAELYAGLEAVVFGIQGWIERTAAHAEQMALLESNLQLRVNLEQVADINHRLAHSPPHTFHEACQWILWYQITARMYNGSGSLGRLDLLLEPFYQQDLQSGKLTDEEAIFHLACLLLRDTAYIQLGGPDSAGRDVTGPVSYLVLEAAHRLKIPANVGVCVGEGIDPGLLRRGVEIMFADKTGIPKFLGINQTTQGFMKNHYPAEIARLRAYAGCHWSALPGREYTLNDCVKINLVKVFDVALRDLVNRPGVTPTVAALWQAYDFHLHQAVDHLRRCLDFHMQHMHQVFPELVLDLLCAGPIEKGEDASHGGVEFYNLCVDGAGLAVVADAFAAIEQRIEQEGRLTWEQLMAFLDADWAGPEGERTRWMMQSVPRYGHGGTRADDYAVRTARLFTEAVKERGTPDGFNLIPGLFSWANTIPMGKDVGATPNGRHAFAPISHGSNPNPGFRKDGASTAMAAAIAAVQPGWGNTAPMQLELDPSVSLRRPGHRDDESVENIASLVRTHFDLGGTQVNLNILDAEKVLEAHRDPSKYPDLVVRVTGFSAYFASLSPEFRQLVVDRIIAERM